LVGPTGSIPTLLSGFAIADGSGIHLFITEDDMRLLVKLLGTFLTCLVGVGLCLGWFSLSTPNPEPDGNKVNINVSVDRAKMKSDVKKAKEKVKEEIREIEGKAKAKEEAK
jgi:hypothetical protein